MVETTLKLDWNHFARIFKSKSDRECIIDAIEFFMKRLNLDGNVRIVRFAAKRYCKDAPTGDCTTFIVKKEFGVRFAGKGAAGRRDLVAVLQTIAHELVHVKQHMFDDLHKQYALNQKLPEDQKVPYRETWWEKEAYDREVPLVREFIESIS